MSMKTLSLVFVFTETFNCWILRESLEPTVSTNGIFKCNSYLAIRLYIPNLLMVTMTHFQNHILQIKMI